MRIHTYVYVRICNMYATDASFGGSVTGARWKSGRWFGSGLMFWRLLVRMSDVRCISFQLFLLLCIKMVRDEGTHLYIHPSTVFFKSKVVLFNFRCNRIYETWCCDNAVDFDLFNTVTYYWNFYCISYLYFFNRFYFYLPTYICTVFLFNFFDWRRGFFLLFLLLLFI